MDAECTKPVKIYSFGKLNEGESALIEFYFKNEGLVPIEDMELKLYTDKKGVTLELMSPVKILFFRPTEVYVGSLRITASKNIKAGKFKIELLPEGWISEEQ